MPAPRNPWIARQRIICSIDEANPHRKLAMVKPAAEIANSNRVPSARDRNPDNGIAITSAIKYDVWTHDTSLELADKPAWISASDAETIWMSTSFGTRTRTGSRCTILVKLPVALSGGSSVNTEPAAGEMLSTVPANLRWP